VTVDESPHGGARFTVRLLPAEEQAPVAQVPATA
jgi:hypothetical protein